MHPLLGGSAPAAKAATNRSKYPEISALNSPTESLCKIEQYRPHRKLYLAFINTSSLKQSFAYYPFTKQKNKYLFAIQQFKQKTNIHFIKTN